MYYGIYQITVAYMSRVSYLSYMTERIACFKLHLPHNIRVKLLSPLSQALITQCMHYHHHYHSQPLYKWRFPNGCNATDHSLHQICDGTPFGETKKYGVNSDDTILRKDNWSHDNGYSNSKT